MSKGRCVDLCFAASLVAGAACEGASTAPSDSGVTSTAEDPDAGDAQAAQAYGSDAPTRKVVIPGVAPQLKEIEADIAARELERALGKAQAWQKADPGNADASYALGLVHSHQGKTAEAKSSFEAAISVAKAHAFAQAALARILAFSDHDLAAGLEHARIAANSMPNWAPGQALYGVLLLELGQAAQAVEHLEASRKLDPGQPDVHFALARAYAATGETDKGLASARTGIELQPGPEGVDIRMLGGRLLCAKGSFPEALEMFEAAFKLAPELHDLRLSAARAFLQYQSADFAEKAIAPLDATVRNTVPVLVTQGRILAARGKLDGKHGALALYEQAAAKDSEVLAPHLYAVEALVGAARCDAARKRAAKIPAALAASPHMQRVRDLVASCEK